MVRAVLFDAAGTLIRVREPVGVTYARMARRCDVEVGARRLEEAFHQTLRTMPAMVFPSATVEERPALERGWWAELVRRTFRMAAPGRSFPDFNCFFSGLFDHYASPAAWEPMAGAQEVLDQLRARQLHTGVVSNFDHRLHGILAGLGFVSRLDVVVLPGDAGAAKPDPHIFHCAVHALGVSVRQAVYIGDDPEHDVVAAEGAGLQAIDVGTLPELVDLLPRLGALP